MNSCVDAIARLRVVSDSNAIFHHSTPSFGRSCHSHPEPSEVSVHDSTHGVKASAKMSSRGV
jgi:hypothetical protein